jgi:hypothetical protein
MNTLEFKDHLDSLCYDDVANNMRDEFQAEGYQDFINDCMNRVANRFPNAKDFTESDVRDFMIDHDEFDVYEFRTWL